MSVKSCKDNLGNTLYTTLRKELKISPKYIMFVAEYVTNGFNATEAYMKSIARKGSKRESCSCKGVEVVKNSNVQKAIRIVIDAWLNEKKTKLDKMIIDSLYREAFYDASMFITGTGAPAFDKLEDIPEEWRRCIVGIETRSYGKDANRSHTIVKLADRSKARIELAKYIELYKEASVSLSMTDETVEKLGKVFRGKKEKKDE